MHLDTESRTFFTRYIIDKGWLQSWLAFVNEDLHRPPPGPISNDQVHPKPETLNPKPSTMLRLVPSCPFSHDQVHPKPYILNRTLNPAPGNPHRQLLDKDGKPKEGLERGQNYRGVNQNVWRIFHQIYGGGPEIVRARLDIYAPAITPPTPA
jgi:hypothetical protein